MKENVGRSDRWARGIVGPALMVLGFTWLGGHKGRWPALAALVGGTVILESAVTRVCPLNHLMSLNKERKQRKAVQGYEVDHISQTPPQSLLPQV